MVYVAEFLKSINSQKQLIVFIISSMSSKTQFNLKKRCYSNTNKKIIDLNVGLQFVNWHIIPFALLLLINS
jgi:hypothetical protein